MRTDGITEGAVHTILTEVGLDRSAFPTKKHFVSLCCSYHREHRVPAGSRC